MQVPALRPNLRKGPFGRGQTRYNPEGYHPAEILRPLRIRTSGRGNTLCFLQCPAAGGTNTGRIHYTTRTPRSPSPEIIGEPTTALTPLQAVGSSHTKGNCL